MDMPEGETLEAEPPLRRRTVVVLVVLVTLLPIAAAVAVFVALSRTESESTFPPLEIGSCVDVQGPREVVTDVQCPSGNGWVISVGSSTLDCPADARWGVIRNGRIYCVQQVGPDETSGKP